MLAYIQEPYSILISLKIKTMQLNYKSLHFYLSTLWKQKQPDDKNGYFYKFGIDHSIGYENTEF